MARIASIGAQKVVDLLADASGLAAAVASLTTDSGVDLPAIPASQVVAQNTAAETLEKSAGAAYPAVHVYCERLKNELREKFRTFSGKARLVAEVRASQDRQEGLEPRVQLYVEAVTQVLDANRGDWGQGMFFTGGYEVAFGPVRHGGKNFLQTAKVTFEVDVSQ